MEPDDMTAAQPLPDHLHAPLLHGGFWKRVAAFLIDGFILAVPSVVVYLAVIFPVIFTADQHPRPAAFLSAFLCYWLVVVVGRWLYFALCESSKWQATPGKLALGLRVTDLQGRRIGFGRASGRYFGKFISSLIFDIGFMMAGWTERKQGLHDLMADTCVVNRLALDAHERGELQSPSSNAPGAGMPGWAVALIVIGACFFMIIPAMAIMAAIAIPAYQDYTIRAQVAEGVMLADGAKTAVAEYMANNGGSLPSDNTAAGLQTPEAIVGRYVTGVQIDHGDIVVSYGNLASRQIAGEHLQFHPQGDDNGVHWACGSDDIPDKFLPLNCRAPHD